MDNISDEYLMMQVKGGELRHAGLLFERYYKRIYGYFYKVLNQPQDAEDATQSVFSRLLKYRHSYDSQRNFRTWLFRIAVNERNVSLNTRLDNSAVDLSEVCVEPAATDPCKLTQRDIMSALNCLNLEDRQLIVLYIWQGLSHQELAQIYQVKANSMRVNVHRALNKLRVTIDAKGAE